MNYPWRYGINSLLLNNRGEKFLDSEFLLGIEPRARRPHAHPVVRCGLLGARHGRAAGLQGSDRAHHGDGDARHALVSDARHRRRRRPRHRHQRVQLGAAGAGQQPGRNGGRCTGWAWRWPAASSNRNGLGAAVRVVVGRPRADAVARRQVGLPVAERAAAVFRARIEATTVDRIEVDWPSGRKQVVTDGLRANTIVKITEPR